jgi:hypothetical protein
VIAFFKKEGLWYMVNGDEPMPVPPVQGNAGVFEMFLLERYSSTIMGRKS